MTSPVMSTMTSSVVDLEICYGNKLFLIPETSRLNVFEIQQRFQKLQDHLEFQKFLLVLVLKKYYF